MSNGSRGPAPRGVRRSKSSVARPRSCRTRRHEPVAGTEAAAAAAVGEDHDPVGAWGGPAEGSPYRRTPPRSITTLGTRGLLRWVGGRWRRRDPRLGARAQREHLVVRDLCEVQVPTGRRRSDRPGSCGRRPRRRLCAEHGDRVARADRDRHDDPPRPPLPERARTDREVAEAGGDPVVDQDRPCGPAGQSAAGARETAPSRRSSRVSSCRRSRRGPPR